jgi:UDP-glucoronosyl and UDP-glucosyl transferase
MTPITIYAGMTGGFGSLAQVMPILSYLDPSSYHIVGSISHGASHVLRRSGYTFLDYPDVGTPTAVTPKGRIWCDLDHYWGRFGFADPVYFGRLIDSRLQMVRDINPQLLLTQFCPPTEIIARILQIPLICVTQSCWHPRGKSLTWWRKQEMDYPKVTPIVNGILEKYNAPPISRMEDLNKGDLTIIPGFPEFDPVDDPNVLYTGLLSWDHADTLADHTYTKLPPFNPANTILVYTGHLYDSGGDSGILILEKVIEAFKDTAYTVLITTGLGQDAALQRYTTGNIHVFDWLPVNRLLRNCLLFIHHGGHGSCMAAINQCVPSLVIPTFQEREFNARQLRLLHLGDFLPPENLTSTSLTEKVSEMVQDHSFKNSLEQLHITLAGRGYGGAAAAAKAITQLHHSNCFV